MLTEAEVKTILLDNLAHMKAQAINLFIKKLLKRDTLNSSIDIHRVKNTVTNTNITTMDEFYAAIDENHLVQNYNFNQSIDPDCFIHGFVVILKNIVVTLDKNSPDDIGWISKYGPDVTNLCFSLRYLNDGDEVIPLRITDVWLVK